MTQEALGERAGLSYKFIGEIERGRANPTVVSLDAISIALKVTVSFLFTEDDDRTDFRRLTRADYMVAREAHDSLGEVLKRVGGLGGRKPKR